MNKVLVICTLVAILACSRNTSTPESTIDYKMEMRNFVIGISTYARSIHPHFIIVPQNGIELVTDNGEATGQPNSAYLQAINAHGQEDLFYGYDHDDQATSSKERSYLEAYLQLSKNSGNTILVTDYCSTPSKMADSYAQNANRGFISFAADRRELDHIPDYPQPIYNENNLQITDISQVKNFLYLINPEQYAHKSDFILAVTATNYDLLIMDLFFRDDSVFSANEVNQLKNKANGGQRLVLAYMSIGEAEDYRYYWQSAWNRNRPSWLAAENPNWAGNYKVRYWQAEWQNIIYGNDQSYLKKILDAGFDGVYLDIIDAFDYFEN